MSVTFSHYAQPKTVPKVALNDDDILILLEVYRHDVLDAHMIRRLLTHRSADKIGRRLNSLRKNGHLIRLPQLEGIFRPGGGSYAKAYSLGDKGLSLLRGTVALPPKKKRYNEAAKRLTPTTIKHALEQARFLTGMRASVERVDGLEFLYPEQIFKRYAPHILDQPTLPRMIQANINYEGYRGAQGTIPDGFFMIIDPTKPEGKQRRTVFLEIDRGTMTIDPSDRKLKQLAFWRDNSILKKFLIYEFAYKTGAHKRQFGIENFQVLTVTTTQQHVEKMQQMYQKRMAAKPLSANPYRYLFMNFDKLAEAEHNLEILPVQNAVGKAVQLFG